MPEEFFDSFPLPRTPRDLGLLSLIEEISLAHARRSSWRDVEVTVHAWGAGGSCREESVNAVRETSLARRGLIDTVELSIQEKYDYSSYGVRVYRSISARISTDVGDRSDLSIRMDREEELKVIAEHFAAYFPRVQPVIVTAGPQAADAAPSRPERRLKIFLCHSSGDKAVVRDIYFQLQRQGFEPWLDEESILGGQDWNLEIARAIRAADVVLVLLSKTSIQKSGYVQREIAHALDIADEKPEGAVYLIPIKLESCDVPERLQRWQWIDLFQQGGFMRLVTALRAVAGLRT